jgi:hypothetical protein
MGNTRINFDQAARDLWVHVYDDLSAGTPGLLGSITGRGEAHVVRLAVIYALLEGASEIGVAHLRAGLAVWNYCFESARYIWGDALGDPMADEILRVLKASPDGLTRWDINNHFHRNKSGAEIDRALGVLKELGRIRAQQTESGGRPTTRYVAL